MQHIHLTKDRGRGRCPTPDLDRNGDGLVSLNEGLPAYGPPAVSLDPFPAPTSLRFEYSRTLRVPPGLALDRGVIVVHGMDVHRHYDDTIPIACGAITPALPQPRSVQPGAAPSTSAYGAQPRRAVADARPQATEPERRRPDRERCGIRLGQRAADTRGKEALLSVWG